MSPQKERQDRAEAQSHLPEIDKVIKNRSSLSPVRSKVIVRAVSDPNKRSLRVIHLDPQKSWTMVGHG